MRLARLERDAQRHALAQQVLLPITSPRVRGRSRSASGDPRGGGVGRGRHATGGSRPAGRRFELERIGRQRRVDLQVADSAHDRALAKAVEDFQHRAAVAAEAHTHRFAAGRRDASAWPAPIAGRPVGRRLQRKVRLQPAKVALARPQSVRIGGGAKHRRLLCVR